MNNSELNTEQVILEAAEAEFLEKGYGNAKMMAIAKRANVAHSMLHYYFRSKENLFQTIYLKKAQTLLPLLENIIEQHLSFSETVRFLTETQFNFLAQNPKLPFFLLTEILTNKENRALLFEVLSQKAVNPLAKLNEMLDEEVKKGAVRPIKFQDLMMNVMSINASTFFVLPIFQDVTGENKENIENMLAERRESNVQFILAALRP
jgi:AcrR family transcriptional regulator